jgi:hypothetical protein
MARKLDRTRYSKAGESVEPDDFKSKFTVATITKVEEGKARKDGTIPLVIKTKEFGDKALWLNVTMIDYLEEKLGDDLDEWIGEKIPLEKKHVKDVSTGEDKVKVYVCHPDDWSDVFVAAKARKK